MADFAPPTGPPPPKVPEGWKAVWNDQYKEWFYVNTHTKQSQWDKPTAPVYAPPADGAPPGPPPSYDHNSSKPTGPEKSGLGSNNPYGGAGATSDEEFARKLQAEENAKVSDRGAADGYYQGGQGSQYGQQPAYGQQAPSPYGQQQASASAPPEKRGLFSKLSGKLGGSSQRPPQQQQGGYGGYPPQQGYPPPGHGGGGYQPGPQYGQGYGGGGYQGYYPQQQQQQRPQKSGMGAGGGALLGAGAGLLGGALLMDAIDDHEDAAYQQGYDNGEAADDGGGDFGGDDGGDF